MTQESRAVVQAILSAGVVGFAFEAPRTFKSGLKSPVYLDNRKLLMHPVSWRVIINALTLIVRRLSIPAPVIAGTETAGIPHSAALAYNLLLPTVFVRKQAKEHGLQQRIEGGDVKGHDVVLVEDQVTTGGSSLSAVQALRDAGATVSHCLAITSYGFESAERAFTEVHVQLHVLVGFSDILAELRATELLTTTQLDSLERWRADPQRWSAEN